MRNSAGQPSEVLLEPVKVTPFRVRGVSFGLAARAARLVELVPLGPKGAMPMKKA